ncbi:MAG: RNA polymerase subunit sigma-24 [Candidatus Hydrogenedentota bacterium]|nr:MAG: RNA polymerase subunit sigma-24 [Candidatus Hydrogenedentota bacterium]
MMYAVAMKLTRNATDAQDLTQNTLLKALRFHDKFKKGTYIKAWLLTIMRNTFINEYRQRARRPSIVELSGTEQAKTNLPDPDILYRPKGKSYSDVLELLDDSVRKAIDELPEEFRIAVVMADVEDKSYKEIADVMECPIGTVMSRLYRGRKLLREKLKDYAEERGLGKSQNK